MNYIAKILLCNWQLRL